MTSFRRTNAQNQTAFRLAALENGWTPIPNVDKRTFYEGWTKIKITPALIEKWERGLGYMGTGLRVENGMCALDVDIDDPEIVDVIWQRSLKLFPDLREGLVRYGSGAKEMWVMRVDEQFSVIASTKHVKPGEDPEGEKVPGYRFESFGGGHARQIGAFGAHTMMADNSGFKIEYVWADELTPADVRLDSLPIIPKAVVLRMAEMAQEEMEKRGWPRVLRSKGGEISSSDRYDLTDDMIFHCLDGESRRLDELADYARTDNNARCSASWTGDRTMVNRTRCLIGVDHKDVPSVLETADYTRHLPASAADDAKPTGEKMAELGEKMKARGYEFDAETYFDAPSGFRAIVDRLHNEWAWCGSRAQQCLPIHRGEELAQGTQNLRMTFAPHTYVREGPRGGVTKVNPVDAWINSLDREDVDGYRFLPDQPPGIYTTTGIRAINSYRAPDHVDVPDDAVRRGHVALWEDFMTHLLPREEEREWFLDSLAHKKQNLTTPGVATVMVARNFGVGRGTLFEIIENIFGKRYVNNVPADHLMGSDGQATYTDWLANALFVTCDEVLPDGDDGANVAWRRRKAYERLKERVDPKPREMLIVRKGLPNYQDMVYATFILATQYENAMPFHEGDRRFVVLTNNATPLAQSHRLMARMNAVRNPTMDPQFTAAVARWLDLRDVSHHNAHVAPFFEGKAKMLEANVTELEDVMEDMLEGMPHDWCTLDTAMDRVEKMLIQSNKKDTYPKWRTICADILKHRWLFHGRFYVDEGLAKKGRIFLRMRGVDFPSDMEERAAQYRDQLAFDVGPSAKLRALRAGLREVK